MTGCCCQKQEYQSLFSSTKERKSEGCESRSVGDIYPPPPSVRYVCEDMASNVGPSPTSANIFVQICKRLSIHPANKQKNNNKTDKTGRVTFSAETTSEVKRPLKRGISHSVDSFITNLLINDDETIRLSHNFSLFSVFWQQTHLFWKRARLTSV